MSAIKNFGLFFLLLLLLIWCENDLNFGVQFNIPTKNGAKKSWRYNTKIVRKSLTFQQKMVCGTSD